MRPAQVRTQRVANWKRQVKPSHISQIADIKTFPKLLRQPVRHFFKHGLTIFSPRFAGLLVLHNELPNLPIRHHHGLIDG